MNEILPKFLQLVGAVVCIGLIALFVLSVLSGLVDDYINRNR